MPLSPAQCRAARALVEWTQDDLQAAAQVAKTTIVDFERGARQPYPRTLGALKLALEVAGVIFIGDSLLAEVAL